MRRSSTAGDVGTWLGRRVTCEDVMIEIIDREFDQADDMNKRQETRTSQTEPPSQVPIPSPNPYDLQSDSLFGKD